RYGIDMQPRFFEQTIEHAPGERAVRAPALQGKVDNYGGAALGGSARVGSGCGRRGSRARSAASGIAWGLRRFCWRGFFEHSLWISQAGLLADTISNRAGSVRLRRHP